MASARDLGEDDVEQAVPVVEWGLVHVAGIGGETRQEVGHRRDRGFLVGHDEHGVVGPQHDDRIEPGEGALAAFD
jgi:hypothetical protein